MRRLGIAAALAAIALAGALALAAVGFADGQKISAISFHDGMRKLWEDHVTWTRLVIVDVAFGTADTQATLERLLQNQVDIGNAIKPFYGEAAGSQLTALLTTHIVLAGNILVNAKAGNTDGVNANVTLWYQNANDIAAFLNGANPKNWPFAHMQDMMKTHLDLTLHEAVAQLTGDYPTSVSTYEQVHLEILQMADMLSAGIIAQFPSMFTGPHAM
ncbi:MAG TPA: hypothetical protein VNP71_07915 [Thermoplasmata archaeon]|nr:hypothetical protein [Thermoplasmata archaeon]